MNVDREPTPLELEERFVSLKEGIINELQVRCKDPEARVRIELVHYIKIASNEMQGGSSALRLDINETWNGLDQDTNEVLQEFAEIEDPNYQALQNEKENLAYVSDPVNRQRLLTGLIGSMENSLKLVRGTDLYL